MREKLQELVELQLKFNERSFGDDWREEYITFFNREAWVYCARLMKDFSYESTRCMEDVVGILQAMLCYSLSIWDESIVLDAVEAQFSTPCIISTDEQFRKTIDKIVHDALEGKMCYRDLMSLCLYLGLSFDDLYKGCTE